DVAGPRARRVADDAGQHAADREIGRSGRAGADAEEADIVGPGAGRQQQHGGTAEQRQAAPAADARPSPRPASWHHPPVHDAPIPPMLRRRPAILPASSRRAHVENMERARQAPALRDGRYAASSGSTLMLRRYSTRRSASTALRPPKAKELVSAPRTL